MVKTHPNTSSAAWYYFSRQPDYMGCKLCELTPCTYCTNARPCALKGHNVTNAKKHLKFRHPNEYKSIEQKEKARRKVNLLPISSGEAELTTTSLTRASGILPNNLLFQNNRQQSSNESQYQEEDLEMMHKCNILRVHGFIAQDRCLSNVASLFPVLSKSLSKGDCGKICVIGGSPVYTGAPYFASITPMKLGADLVYVHCHPNAASVIKTYSPELIVYPSLNFDDIKVTLSRVDAVVFGPGIGREPELIHLLKKILDFMKNSNAKCLVIDADGLFLLLDCLDNIKGCKNVILTPNYREFERICEKVFHGLKGVQTIAKKLDTNVVLKGEQDVITDGLTVRIGSLETSLRRCGGQGDILSGAIALFVFWAKLRANSLGIEGEHIFEGALAASDMVRYTSRKTFERVGRSMNATDIIGEIRHVVKEIEQGDAFD